MFLIFFSENSTDTGASISTKKNVVLTQTVQIINSLKRRLRIDFRGGSKGVGGFMGDR